MDFPTATAYFFSTSVHVTPFCGGVVMCFGARVLRTAGEHTRHVPAPSSLANLATAIPHGAKRLAEPPTQPTNSERSDRRNPKPNQQTVSKANQ